MSRIRAALRTTLAAGLIVAGASVAASVVAPGVGHADVPISFSANLHCGASITDKVTVFNLTATDMVVKVSMVTSLQTTSQTVNLPGSGAVDVTFSLTIGERLDKFVFRDADDVVVWQAAMGAVITGAGDCFRAAFDLFELTAYSLTCVDGVTHAAISIENRGDYAREVTANADATFPTAGEYTDAYQAGLVFPDTETLLITPGATRVFHLEFKVVDAFELYVRRSPETIFADGPRIPVAGEGCGTATEVTDPTTTSTTVADTTPETTPDSAPDTTDDMTDSQGPGATSTVPALTVVEQAPRTLPVTGRSSLPIGLVAGLLLAGGLVLVRTTRRGYR